MLNVALVGLLAGTLAIGGPDGGDSKKTTDDGSIKPVATVETAVPGIFTSSIDAPAPAPRTVQDTYAYGIANRDTPLRIWAEYGYGEAESLWNTDGGTTEITIAGTDGDIVSQRFGFGAEVGLPVNLIGFGIGVGADLTLAKNKFQVGATPGPFITEDLSSGMSLQGLKLYGIARSGAIGLHGGYVFDFGNGIEYGDPVAQLGGARLPTNLSTSDTRPAIFFGADFDYPSDRIRLFGGVDYYLLQTGGDDSPNTPTIDEGTIDGDDILNAVAGAGLKFSVFELGAALQIQTRFSAPSNPGIGTVAGIGSSAATIAPYLRISPPQIPATIFVKGAVQDEYTEYGYLLGGSNSIKPSIGFTAGLTFGFE